MSNLKELSLAATAEQREQARATYSRIIYRAAKLGDWHSLTEAEQTSALEAAGVMELPDDHDVTADIQLCKRALESRKRVTDARAELNNCRSEAEIDADIQKVDDEIAKVTATLRAQRDELFEEEQNRSAAQRHYNDAKQYFGGLGLVGNAHLSYPPEES